MKKLLLSLFVLTAVGCGRYTERYVDLVKEVQPKAVTIEVDTIVSQLAFRNINGEFSIGITTRPATFLGAGVVISSKGHILTCAHLFTHEPILAMRVFEMNSSTIPTTLLFMSKEKDLALLKISSPTPGGYATLSNERIQIGQEVIAVGNPLGLPFSVSHGIISAFRPNFYNGYDFTQDDAAINHGNSGGPLFNLSGELIGINTLKADEGEGLSFAVSPQTIREFLGLFAGL